MALPRVLLLDLDEVVFRHPAAHAVVSRRVVGLMSRTLSLPHQAAGALNRQLYEKHGHTLIGLRKELAVRLSVTDFNAAVYAPETLAEVARLPRHPHTAQRASEAARLLIEMRRRDVDVYVFSNAPRLWCDFALGLVGLGGVFAPERLLTSDSCDLDTCDLVLKPSSLSYEIVQHAVRSSRIAFVDDSLRNLEAAPASWDTFVMCNLEPGQVASSAGCSRATPISRLDELV